MTTDILFEKKDKVATITLNRPEKLNAMTMEMLRALHGFLDEIESDDQVWAVVITAVGRAFCTGMDLQTDFGTTANVNEAVRLFAGMVRRVEKLPMPVIGAVNGMALAGGMELTCACDLLVAVESARLGDQHAKFGIVPGAGDTQRLPRLIGMRRAKELLYTGKWITAAQAKEWGLVNEVAPEGKLEETVKAITDDLVQTKSPLAISLMKMAADVGIQTDIDTGQEIEVQAVLRYGGSHDHTEGLAAFREKRKPNFKGRGA